MKTVSSVSLTPKDIFKLIEGELQKVELALKTEGHSAFPLVEDINSYLHDSGGKRFRPVVLLLSSKLGGFEGKPAIILSVVVELIHVATLVHDDIIDNAEVRRGQTSVNAKWGNQVTVLMGDWLYMTSFYLALRLRNFRVLDLLIDVTRQMVEGELIQWEQYGRIDLSVEDQLEICRRKTAHLFSGCGRLGAILADMDEQHEERLGTYGHAVGMAFQLTDDLLDYTSNEDTLGKPVLKDLEEGNITLPIIYLMQRADQKEQEFVREVVRTQDFSSANKKRIMDLVQAYGTLSEVQNLAEEYVRKAKTALVDLPDSIYRDALLNLADFVIDRKN